MNLDQLAALIETEHEAARRVGDDLVDRWLRQGDLLRVTKERVDRELGYGHWTQWLDEKCPKSARSAQRYMRLASHRPKVDQIRHGVAEVSLRALDRALALPKLEQVEKELKLLPEQLLLPASSVSLALVVDDLKVKVQEMALLRRWIEQGHLRQDDLLRVEDAFDSFLAAVIQTQGAIALARAGAADPGPALEPAEMDA